MTLPSLFRKTILLLLPLSLVAGLILADDYDSSPPIVDYFNNLPPPPAAYYNDDNYGEDDQREWLPLRRGYGYEDYFYASPRCQFSQFGFIKAGETFGKGIAIQDSYTTLTALFAPLMAQDAYYPFLDLRGHYIKDNFWAGNFGCGLRWRDCLSGYIFGANVYYDYRRTHVRDYNQVGCGLEFFTENFELRFNAYFPVGETCGNRNHFFNDYVGDFFVSCHQVEVAQRGIDAELGHLFWRCTNFFLYGGIGGYYYADCNNCHQNGRHQPNHDHQRHRWGEKARVTLGWGSFINLEGRYFHDQIEKSAWQGALTISIPLDFCFGPSFWENYERVFTQPVSRNEMVVKKKLNHWTTNYSY